MDTETLEGLIGKETLDRLSENLKSYLLDLDWAEKIKVTDDGNTAVVLTTRGVYPTSGGTAKWSQIRVWHKGQIQMREWQYKFSWGADRWDLLICSIESIEVTDAADQIKVSLRFQGGGDHHPIWGTDFMFGRTGTSGAIPELSDEDQARFGKLLEGEMGRIMGTMERNWQNSPSMPSPHGRVRYRQPRMKEVKRLLRYGVACFVTEEQIDFHSGIQSAEADCQMQYKAYLLKSDWKEAKEIAESHGYEQRGGCSVVSIANLSAQEAVIQVDSRTVTLKV